MTDNQNQEEITIKISFSGGIESLFPKITNILEAMQGGMSPVAQPKDDDLLTPDELATLLKIPKSKIYGMTMKTGPGSIPRFKVGRDLRFKRSEVLPWFESQNQ